jgi:hypothetical protein
MTAAEIAAVIAGITGLIAGASAYRKMSTEGYDSTVIGLGKLTAELRQELDREKTIRRELEAKIATVQSDCDAKLKLQADRHAIELDEMRSTIYRQAQQISRLERRPQSRTRKEDSE